MFYRPVRSMLKCGHKDAFLEIGRTRLHANEFAGWRNIRELDTLDQMAHIPRGMDQKRIMYKDLIA